jgi:hypothetical protein
MILWLNKRDFKRAVSVALALIAFNMILWMGLKIYEKCKCETSMEKGES